MKRFSSILLIMLFAVGVLTVQTLACCTNPIAGFTVDRLIVGLGDRVNMFGCYPLSYDPDGGAITYHWSFGSGAADISGASGCSPSCKYTTIGPKKIELTVTDHDWTDCCWGELYCLDKSTEALWHWVTVSSVDKITQFNTTNEGPLYVCIGQTVQLYVTSSGGNFPPNKPDWTIVSQPSGGNPTITPVQSTAYVSIGNLTVPGTYTLKATCGADDPGDTITITAFRVITETVATLPTNRSRQILGINEVVTCSTDPPINVEWFTDSGTIDPSIGSTTRYTASLYLESAVVTARKDSTLVSVGFTILKPAGMIPSNIVDPPNDVPGPPNNQIGPTYTNFLTTTFPMSVNFYNVWFRENIPYQTWMWPDGTQGDRHDIICRYRTSVIDGVHNRANDYVGEGPFPIVRIHNGLTYVDHLHTISVPIQHEYGTDQWIGCFTNQHNMEYRGLDQKARVQFSQTGVSNSVWLGPWQ